MQLFIVAERLVVVESKSLLAAMKDLIAVYFVFNIEYPKALMATYVFIQHCILNLKDDQALPNTAVQVVSALANF